MFKCEVVKSVEVSVFQRTTLYLYGGLAYFKLEFLIISKSDGA